MKNIEVAVELEEQIETNETRRSNDYEYQEWLEENWELLKEESDREPMVIPESVPMERVDDLPF